ncbi:endonuclease [Carboxylicivirga sp. N1Y90]|uniref:endonuclease n=1 Tax=Carboxylicivirga fragile TaxID=3417571 RepID=UPI003D3457CA|nr:endonuclease [Marinilabiliaceae bacterium N1Y90]
MKIRLLPFIFLFISGAIFAQIPTDYYSSAEGKTGYALKTELYNIIKDHSDKGYTALWTCYRESDVKSNGKVWDMYSDVPGGTPAYEYTFGTDQCGNVGPEGTCYNREHLVPQSWFSKASPMKNDAHHVIPSDGKVNGQRGSFPFSEVTSYEWISTNGSKRGNSSFNGYSGTSFEPIDEYKGDIARCLFYVATRYENVIANWENNGTADAILDGSSDKVFKDWQLNLLIKWHNQDPVSDKEIARNKEIYKFQGNANPFINHPEYVLKIWDPSNSGGTGPDPDPNPTTIFFEDFETCSVDNTINLSNWTNSAETGNITWNCKNFYGSNNYAELKSYQSGDSNNDAWLVTSQIDVSDYENCELSFKLKGGYDNGATIQAYILTNYSGNNPWNSTKTELSFSQPFAPANEYSNDFTLIDALDLSAYSGTFHVAFKYSGGDGIGKTTTWQLDDILVTGVPVSTDINEEIIHSFKLYPNPSKGEINVEGDFEAHSLSLHLYNISGKVVYSEISANFNKKTIQLSHLPKGLYYLKITSEIKQFSTQKVILH